MNYAFEKKEKESKEINHSNPSKFEYYIELIFDKFSKVLRLIGPLFAFALTVFISIVTHAFFNVILPFYIRMLGEVFAIILVFIALFILFNLLFNYFMAVLVKPGSVSELKFSKFYKKHDPMKIDPEIIDLNTVFNNPINRHMKAAVPQKDESTQNNLFQFKSNKNFTINNEDTLINMNRISDNVNNSQSVENPITEDLIDDLTNNIKDDMDSIPKLNENDLTNEINLLNLNQIEETVPKKNTSDPIIINNNQIGESMKIIEENSLNNNNASILDNKNNTLDTANVSPPNINKCKYCKELKVLRSHHCQVCGICVLKMDHHCPWINNCVGHSNHRYFILFLTWLGFGCLFVGISSFPIMFNSSKIKRSHEFNFISVLCLVGVILMTFFNSWNWFLVIRGNTTIEFWTLKSGFKTENRVKDFSLPNWRDNIFLVFGTRSILQAIFCASKKKLPVSGLEWTRLSFPDYFLDSEYFMEDNVSEEKTKMIVNSNV